MLRYWLKPFIVQSLKPIFGDFFYRSTAIPNVIKKFPHAHFILAQNIWFEFVQNKFSDLFARAYGYGRTDILFGKADNNFCENKPFFGQGTPTCISDESSKNIFCRITILFTIVFTSSLL